MRFNVRNTRTLHQVRRTNQFFNLFTMFTIYRMCQPLAVGYMVGHFQNGTDDSSLHISAGVLLSSAIASVLIYFPTIMGLSHCALKMKIALASLLFRKSLRLNGAGNGTLAGRAVSLMTGDIGRMDLLVLFVHNIWIGPLVTAASGAIIYMRLGPVALLGLLIVLLSIPLQGTYIFTILIKH